MPLGASWDNFGPSWGQLVAEFGQHGAILDQHEPNLGQLEPTSCRLGADLVSTWAVLGPTWVRKTWKIIVFHWFFLVFLYCRPSCNIEARLSHLGSNLGATWTHLEPTRAQFGLPWAQLRPSWGQLGTYWSCPGVISVPTWAILGPHFRFSRSAIHRNQHSIVHF